MTQPPHILIVDDHRDIRDALVKYLEKNGMRATSAANAVAMDAAMKVGQFDLIVLDLMMPGEDGLSVCRRLRAQGAIPMKLTVSWGWRSGPTTICPNPSIRVSCWPGSRRSCADPTGGASLVAALPGTDWPSTDGCLIRTAGP